MKLACIEEAETTLFIPNMQYSHQKQQVEVASRHDHILRTREYLWVDRAHLPAQRPGPWLVFLQWFAGGSGVMGKAKKGRAHSKANRQDPLGSSNRGKDKPEADTPQAHYLLNEVSRRYTREADRCHRFQSQGAGW